MERERDGEREREREVARERWRESHGDIQYNREESRLGGRNEIYKEAGEGRKR